MSLVLEVSVVAAAVAVVVVVAAGSDDPVRVEALVGFPRSCSPPVFSPKVV